MHSYSAMAIVSIQWIVIGYSLSFGPDWHGLIGTFDWFGLNGVSYAPNPDYSSTIPHNLFMMFQLMFAILTPALISGHLPKECDFQLSLFSSFYGQQSFTILSLIGYGALADG